MTIWDDIQMMASEGREEPPKLVHGKLSTYQKKGCRCEACTRANYENTQKYLARKAAAA